MNLVLTILFIIIASIIIAMKVFRSSFIKWALRIRAKLKIASLRKAIEDADINKKKTGRKTLVVFNLSSQKYEPIEKKLLKQAANANKRKKNKTFTHERVRAVEKNALYVAR